MTVTASTKRRCELAKAAGFRGAFLNYPAKGVSCTTHEQRRILVVPLHAVPLHAVPLQRAPAHAKRLIRRPIFGTARA